MLSHCSLSEVLPLEGQNTIVPNRCLCAALKLPTLSSPKSVLDFREDNLSICVMAAHLLTIFLRQVIIKRQSINGCFYDTIILNSLFLLMEILLILFCSHFVTNTAVDNYFNHYSSYLFLKNYIFRKNVLCYLLHQHPAS